MSWSSHSRLRPWFLLTFAGFASGLAGCDYASSRPSSASPGSFRQGTAPVPLSHDSYASEKADRAETPERREQQAAVLENVVNLIQTAAIKPGGNNFKFATENLNQYFKGTKPAEYAVSPETRAFLDRQTLTLKPEVKDLETPAFTLRDARHLEDCMLYYGIATRIAGPGDDLTRARRVFDWMTRHVMLIPARSLDSPGLPQVAARPYDVLLRGMATEQGNWAERSWLFLSLCRQLGLDAGLVSYTPPGEKQFSLVWLCAVLIDKKAYLFDAGLGMPVPGPTGAGVATLEDVLTDPRVLARLDLPGQAPYRVTRADLLNSPSKIDILLDSSQGYCSPRMRLLQRELQGKNRALLYRDPIEQQARFAEALGPRLGTVKFWDLPFMVETLLFTDQNFNQATQAALFLFRPELPLVYARIKHLRGETSEAISDYVKFRFAEAALLMDGKTPIPRPVQDALDIYSTYFLGLCHLEQNNPVQAEFFFKETLKLLPAPGPGQFYYNMFRWGAATNLGRLAEAKGDPRRACAYDSLPNPTLQAPGNLLRARNLLWDDPFAPLPDPLPPPPVPSLMAPAELVPERK